MKCRSFRDLSQISTDSKWAYKDCRGSWFLAAVKVWIYARVVPIARVTYHCRLLHHSIHERTHELCMSNQIRTYTASVDTHDAHWHTHNVIWLWIDTHTLTQRHADDTNCVEFLTSEARCDETRDVQREHAHKNIPIRRIAQQMRHVTWELLTSEWNLCLCSLCSAEKNLRIVLLSWPIHAYTYAITLTIGW